MTYKRKTSVTWSENDEKIYFVGKVVETGNGYFKLRDSFGEVKIKSNFTVENDEVIRVFCRVEDGEPVAELIQNLNGLNLELFEKASSLFESL